MRKWLYDRPWIWIVLLLGILVAAGFVVVVIAEMNRPEIVKEKRPSHADASLLMISEPAVAGDREIEVPT